MPIVERWPSSGVGQLSPAWQRRLSFVSGAVGRTIADHGLRREPGRSLSMAKRSLEFGTIAKTWLIARRPAASQR